MLSAPLGPEIVKDEAVKNVEGLLDVREAPNMVSLNARGGRLFFRRRLRPAG